MAKVKNSIRKKLRKPDEFVVATGTIYNFAKGRKKQLIWGAAGLAVAILGISYGTALVHRSKINNYNEFIGSIDTSLSVPAKSENANPFMMAPVGQNAPGASGDADDSSVARAERVKEALGKAEAYLKDNDSGKYALMAKLNAASLYAELGQYDQAEPLYRFCIDTNRGKDAELEFLSLNGLAQLLESQNKASEASEIYTRIIDSGDSYRAAWAALNKGRILAASGNTDQAKTVWQEALDKNPDSPHAEQLRLSISRI